MIEVGDVLQLIRYFCVVEGAGNAEICLLVVLIALPSFEHIDQHYTFTLSPDTPERDSTEDKGDDGNDCEEE